LALKIAFFSFTAAFLHSAWAGTAIQAQFQDFGHKGALTNLKISIESDKMRVDFRGSASHGSLIYDRDTSLLTVVDHLHQAIYQITPADQFGIKLLAGITAARIQGRLSAGQGKVPKDWKMARQDILAFFSVNPILKTKGVSMEGFPCDEYGTDSNTDYGREFWVTTPESAGMNAEDFHTYRSLLHLGLDLFGDALSQLGVDTTALQQDWLGEELPVAEVLQVRGKMACKFSIKNIRPQSFAPEAFNPPAGYGVKSLVESAIIK
jgi:hypothetical protein